MKTNKLLFGLFIFAQLTSFAQTTTITYSGSGLCTLCCNALNTSPTTTIGGIKHYPVSGGVTFDGTNLVLEAINDPINNKDQGTAYSIAYPFKVGYKYTVAINMKHSSTPPGVAPSINISLFKSPPDPNAKIQQLVAL